MENENEAQKTENKELTITREKTQVGEENDNVDVQQEKETEKPFGKLMPLEYKNSDLIPLVRKKIIFQRGEDPDKKIYSITDDAQIIHLGNNMRVSGNHFFIEYVGGDEWTITDTSTNGTFLNGDRITKNEPTKLKQNDIIGALKPIKQAKLQDNSLLTKWMFILENDNNDVKTQEEKTETNDKEKSAAETAATSTSLPTSSPPPSAQDNKSAKLQAELECSICGQVMYNCVSTIPCLHSACAFCLSAWLKKNRDKCPTCRGKIDYIVRNHKVRSLIDAYLAMNPAEKRPQEEIDEMEKDNTLTEEVLRELEDKKHMKKRRRHDDYSDSEDSYDSEEEYSDDDGNGRVQVQCRQCLAPGPDGFQCPPALIAEHNLCSNCFQYFPRRNPATTPGLAPSECAFCHRIYCNLYWGCHGPMGASSFRLLRDHEVAVLPKKCILNNETETTNIEKIVIHRKTTLTATWKEIANLLDNDAGWANVVDALTTVAIKGDTPCCNACFTRILPPLFLKWRESLDKATLPDEIKNKPDCYYGKNCRTQMHNDGHAQKYNHICDQKRF